MRRFGEAFAIAGALGICIGWHAQAKDAPSTRPTTAAATTSRSVASSPASHDHKSDAAANTAVSAAIRDLAHEYAAHQGDPKKPLRGVCNYFKDHPSSEITTD